MASRRVAEGIWEVVSSMTAVNIYTYVPIATPESYQIDTTNVLFILSGAFVGLDTVVKRRIAKGVSGLKPSNHISNDPVNWVWGFT